MVRCSALLLFLVAATAQASDALIEAASNGDSTAALAQLAEGADANHAAVDGTTALHWAVYRQDLALVEALLAQQADPNRRNDYAATPLSVAAEHGDYAIMQALLAAGGDIEAPNDEGQTLLMAVARTGNTDTARLLLQQGAQVDAVEQWGGQTALMWAAAQQQPDMVRLLIEHGADVDRRSKDQDWPRWVTSEPRVKFLDQGGFTPLLYAAREGCADCVAALLDGGADIDLTDLWGQTPLLMALLNLHYDTAALLIERGADIQRWDWWGRTPLYNAIDLHQMTASSRGDLPSTDTLTALDIARTLLRKGANVDMRLKYEPPFRGGDRGYTDGSPDSRVLSAGATALHKAAKAGDVEAVKLLLDHNARVDSTNVLYEVTPLLAAAGVWRVYGIFRTDPISGQFTTGAQAAEVVKLLIDAGADIHARASNGHTVAHGAALAGWHEVLQLAHAQGGDFSATDVGGYTARDLAVARGNTATVAFIDTLVPPAPARMAPAVSSDLPLQQAILAALSQDLSPATASADQIAQAAVTLAFTRAGELERNLTDVTVALGELTRAGSFPNAPHFGDGSPVGRLYLKVLNLASSNPDVSSSTYYGLTVQDMTRLTAAVREGSNILNGARSNAITRK